MKVGFIGLGNQGGPMATMIANAGHHLTVWARRPEALSPFVALGAHAAATPAELAAEVDLLGICVVSDDDVRDVLLTKGALAAMRPGSTLAIHSTVAPSTCLQIAEVGAARGVRVIDAPVSGSGDAALKRQLTVMVGGDAAAIAHARPVFESFSDGVIEMGALGGGQLAKIVNNVLFLAQIELARAALAFGADLGLRRDALTAALARSSGSSYALGVLDRMLAPEMAEHLHRLFAKDVTLAVDAADTARVSLGPLGSTAQDMVDRLAGGSPQSE